MNVTGTAGGRCLRFRLDPSSEPTPLSRVVADRAEGLSVRSAKELIDRGWVFVDDRRIVKGSFSVPPGARVEVFLHPRAKRIELRPEDLLWEGRAVVAVNKPPGLLAYGTHGVTQDTVIPRLERLLKDMGRWRQGRDRLVLVHRLDRDSSGVLLVARSAEAASALEGQFRRQKVEKRYVALVHGRPRKERFRRESAVRAKRPDSPSGSAEGPPRGERWAGSWAGSARAAAVKGRQGPTGITDFEVVRTFPNSDCALIEARPLTGRTHQIRVHLAQLGHPVLGDIVYGPEKCADPLFRAIPRQMLHASFLGVEDPDGAGRLEFAAAMPEDMNQVLDRLEAQTQGG